MPRKTTPYKPKDYAKKRPKTLMKKPSARKTVRWAMDEPKGEQRIAMYKKCRECILVPPKPGDDLMDPDNYKFPICTKLSKTGGKCQFNCKGIVAANRRARLTKKYPKVEELTRLLIERWQCTKKAVKEAQAKKTTKKKPATRKRTPAPPRRRKRKQKTVVGVKKQVKVKRQQTSPRRKKKTTTSVSKKMKRTTTRKRTPTVKRQQVKKQQQPSKRTKK